MPLQQRSSTSSASSSSVRTVAICAGMLLLVQFTVCVTAASLGERFTTTAASVIPSSGGESSAATEKNASSTSSSSSTATVGMEAELLDRTKLSFLASCDGKDKMYERYCDLYRNLSTALAKRAQDPVTPEQVNQMLGEKMDPVDASHLCQNLVHALEAVKQKQQEALVMDRVVMKEFACTQKCLAMDDDGNSHPLPLCRVLLWGFRKLATGDEKPASLEEQAANVVVRPMIPDVPVKEEKKDAPIDSKASAPVAVTPPNNTVTPPGTKVPSKKKEDEPVPAAPGAAGTATDPKPVVVVANTEEKPVVVTPKTTTSGRDDDAALLPLDEQNEKNMAVENQDNGGNTNGDEPVDDYDQPLDSEESFDPEGLEPKAVKEQQQQQQQKQPERVDKFPEPQAGGDNFAEVQREEFREDPFFEESDSNFFAYFLLMMFGCIVCYVAYHNKSKLLALALEGRRSSSSRGGFSKGRKHTAAYRKLDSNLEEAITSNASASSRSTSQIIY